jgi:hypothetical protein
MNGMDADEEDGMNVDSFSETFCQVSHLTGCSGCSSDLSGRDIWFRKYPGPEGSGFVPSGFQPGLRP